MFFQINIFLLCKCIHDLLRTEYEGSNIPKNAFRFSEVRDEVINDTSDHTTFFRISSVRNR